MTDRISIYDIQDKIKAFLKDKREAENATYAPVYSEDMENLYDIVYCLLELKFERDVDGDLPVSCHLVDKTRYLDLSGVLVRHEPRSERLEDVLSNLSMWTHMAEIEIKNRRLRGREGATLIHP